MHWRDVFRLRQEFAVGPSIEAAERLFYNRYCTMKQSINANNTRASNELALMQQDRTVRPKPLTNHCGEFRWEGSAAQRFLKDDIAAGQHERLTAALFYMSRSEYQEYPAHFIRGHVAHERMPAALFYKSRPEYQEYPAHVIRGHVAQEVRLHKFLKQYGDLRR
jgi:hypothetical protein